MLGIQRLGHVTLTAADPEGAAAFAAERLGFTGAAPGPGGAQRLAARGADPYALAYVPGTGPALDHAAFVVPDAAALDAAAAALGRAGVAVERATGDAAALRFRTPAGHGLALGTGPTTPVPVAHLAAVPGEAPAPVCPDHVGLGVPDVAAEEAFFTGVLGLRVSARVLTPGGTLALSFLRVPGRLLFHQVALVATPSPRLHHVQFTLKNLDALHAAVGALTERGVDVAWGPVRHGPGHTVACYFQDGSGAWVEYSVEEEIVLDDNQYEPRTWQTDDPRVSDEWGSGPPPAALAIPGSGAIA